MGHDYSCISWPYIPQPYVCHRSLGLPRPNLIALLQCTCTMHWSAAQCSHTCTWLMAVPFHQLCFINTCAFCLWNYLSFLIISVAFIFIWWMNHPIAVYSPLMFINVNNFKTAVWYLGWISGCWWFRCHAVRWWDPVCWEGNRNLVPENVVDNVIDSRGEKTIALCNNYTLNKVIMLSMYQVDCYTVLFWWQ